MKKIKCILKDTLSYIAARRLLRYSIIVIIILSLIGGIATNKYFNNKNYNKEKIEEQSSNVSNGSKDLANGNINTNAVLDKEISKHTLKGGFSTLNDDKSPNSNTTNNNNKNDTSQNTSSSSSASIDKSSIKGIDLEILEGYEFNAKRDLKLQATDKDGSDISDSIILERNNVNTIVPGIYTVKASVRLSNGEYKEKEFTVTVKETRLDVSLLTFKPIKSNVKKGEKFYRTTFFIPVIISSVVIGQLWQKIYNGDYGLLNSLLSMIGIQGQDWIGQESTALVSAFIPNLWQYIGYHMLIMYAGIKSISPDINEAARIDGASKTQIAFKITIPLLKPVLQVCATFSLIGALKIFDLIYVLTGGGPFFSTEVPTIYMYKTIFDSFKYGYGSAIAIFVIIECLILTGVLRLLFRDKEKA